jgi:hypothetical protein
MSFGGKTKETQQIDPALRDASLAQLDMARAVGQLGFVPYKGDTVAGFQPGQIAAMQNTNTGLEAFGLGTSAVPAAGNLSPYAIYQQQLAQMDPGQREFIQSMFINPMTGAAPTQTFGPQSYYNAPQKESDERKRKSRSGGGSGSSSAGASGSGGYTGVRDMFDGGGPGRSGSTFSGGPVSGRLNRAGIKPASPRDSGRR